MKKSTLLAIFAILLFAPFSFSQSVNPWRAKAKTAAMKQPDRKTIPEKYNVVTLDIPTLRSQLGRAVKRDDNNNLPFAVQIDFPLEDGSTETFNIERVSVLHPDLEAKFTEIRSYFGVSAKNPLNKIFISMDPGGFTGLITGEKTIYIDPYNFRNNGNDYIVYDRSEASRDPENPFICMADMKDLDINLADGMPTPSTARNSIDGKLRTYRIAIACTSEYSAYFGNTMSTILAAVNTTITRVNSVYRNDFAVVFQVVASENRLVYINEFNIDTPTPDPDPYDNYNGSTMLSANTSNITGIIGASAYDIGHVFSTGGGGIASVAPCNASSKGSGVTGIVSPQNDPFDIDYVCHEIGHQFSAGHTYYNACFGSKVSDDYEPGSGTTIMGYAGVCSPNVQYNSDAYFHSRSIAQITAAIATHTCETETAIANTEPIASAGLDYTIPKGTPFTLTGSATDVDTADVLTYCWEQFDATDGGTQPPVGTNTAGPVFRSYFATTSPLRTFPKMSAVVSNTTPTWEVLPSVARALNFRLTVRDNSTLGGQTNSDNMLVTVSTAGPFAVTAPNTAVVWYVGETKTVTWNVAGTSATPVSTANVAIKLSTDGGYTYPVTILASTANDGTENITVPSNIGKNMRIKVEAVGNIYFDISNVDFEIKANTFELTTAQATVPTCKPANAVFTVTYTKATPFTETTSFSVTGLPAGATAAFSPTSLAASGTVTMTISGISGVAAGIYPLTFRGISPSANIPLSLTLKVFDNAIGTATLTSPSNGAGNQQTSTLLTWSDLVTASSYLVQISTNPTFSTITETATVTTPYYQTTGLTQGTINYWRIKPINPCIDGAFSEVYVFQIANDLCKTYSNVYFQGNDAVWETTGTNAVSARLDVPDDIMISDVNLTLTGTHTSMTDLKMQFSGPTGNFAEIYNRDCSGSGMNVTWDDSASPIPTGCSGGLTGTKQPNQPLSNFNGSSSLGTWILLATDRVTGAGGTFTGMSMTVCGKLQIVNNVTATINALGMQSAGTATIPSGKLLAAQPSATAAQLTYNITQLPAYGTLKLSGTALTLGGSFTQADVNNNLLTYVHGGANTNPDNFKFSVKGNNTALLGGQVMNINICSVSNTSSQTNVSCFGGTDGSATVVASGGTAPYTYSWSPSGGTAATASTLSAGTYTCTITDASGCTKDQSFTITQPTAAISNTTAQTNVSCFGGNDGSATVVASGGTPGYTYLWSPSGGTAASATGLAAGTYTVRITDTKGCFKDQSFTITQPTAAISNTTAQTNVSCFGGTDGSATVVASGGTPGYTYLWSPSGGTAASATGLAAGTYTVRITDTKGCFKDQSFTITQPTAAISNTTAQTNVSCFGGNNGSATVVASGGTPGYTYLWSPSGGTAASATGLAAGTYTVRITDTKGCFKDQSFTITQPTAAITNTTAQTNVSCFGGTDGSATVVASGGTPGYTYLWSPSGGTAASATGLAAGTYTVRITDTKGCFKDQSFTITQPTAAISNTTAQTNVSCFGGTDGSATVVASGGTPGYTYLWSPSGGTAASATGLAAGTYTVRITDTKGCFKDQSFTITQPTAAISNTTAQTNVSCFGGTDGSATVVASGGTPGYTYLWSPSGGTAASATGLAAGTYTVRITDTKGCFKDQSFTITQPTAAISNTTAQTNVSCFGGNNGSATVVASGGTPGYTYLWSPSGGTAASATGLAAGTYTVRITDTKGCFKDQSFTITQPTAAISNTTAQTNVSCFGGTDGSATVVASGGTPGYTYLWSPSGGTAASATGLAAGTYTVRITDTKGCFKDQSFTITQPTAAISNTTAQTNVSCFGGTDGSATVVASGGTPGYTYLWSPSGGTAASATGLAAGTYTVRITDTKGCFKDQSFTITQPTAAISNTTAQTNVSCFGGTDGSATVVASGGTPGYTYLWSPSGGTAASATGLAAGTYTVRITDTKGCFKDQSFTITQPTAAISNTTAQTNVSCFGGTDGSATVVASGGTPGYTYLWSPSGGTAASATGLAAGIYTVRITDTKGCFKDQSFTITQPAVLSNTFSQTTISCFGETDATATVIASGGSGIYSYSWSPTGGNSATATNLAPGSYTCTITDSNGCSKIQNFTVSTPIITTWNGSVWDNGYPTNGVKAIVNANYTSVGDLTACQLEVNGSSLVTVQSGHDFNIAGKVTVASNALITFENNANLLQTIDVANSGSIISKRNAQMRRQDYVYWSSPVLNQNLLAFSPLTLTNRFYTLDEPSNAFAPINPSANSFDVAKGYMIRAPNTFTTAVSTFFGQFIGVPNNGTKTIPVTVNGQGYNLIGNPYPSPVSGNAFLASNPGTLYFWTHTSQDAASGANYASYNTTGGVASIAGGAVPNGTIQTGQGFILSKSSAGVATFTNAMRSGNNNGQFFRDANVERHRIWLNLSDTAGPKNQILVAYMDGATQAFDESIDGELLENGSAISSIIDNSNYVIQGRALPFSDTDSVPLHFKAATAGTFTIGIDHMDGLFGLGQTVYIKDNMIGLTHNLSSGDYSFDTAEGNFADRFEIVYQSAPLGTETPVMEANHVVVFTQSGIVNVKNSKEEISKIKIFDVRGRLIYEKENINAQTATLNDLKTQQQVLLVQVTSVNNIVVTKKIVY